MNLFIRCLKRFPIILQIVFVRAMGLQLFDLLLFKYTIT